MNRPDSERNNDRSFIQTFAAFTLRPRATEQVAAGYRLREKPLSFLEIGVDLLCHLID